LKEGKGGKMAIKDDRNFHQRLQEFCDCYLETDPKKELEKAAKGISGDPSGDLDELALKFLGLGIFYGASEKAKRISIERSKEGRVLFIVEARGQYQLPPPSTKIADRIISIARSITHIDKAKGRILLNFIPRTLKKPFPKVGSVRRSSRRSPWDNMKAFLQF
jgi:hypothetical protein